MTTAVPVGTFKPGSDEWHAARQAGLGGSEIAAVLGLSPWVSRFSLWHLKSGLIDPQASNPGMEWGTRLEDAIAGKFAEVHPEFSVWPSGTWRHKDRPWQIANPDRLICTDERRSVGGEADAIYEGKTAHSMDSYAWGREGTDEIPVYYRCQVLWYLDVFSYQRCHLAVLIGGSDYREYTIVHDEAEAAMMRGEAELFLATVAAGDRPDIDDSEITYQTIRELNPNIDGNDAELPEDLALHYMQACQDYKAAEADKRQAAARVLDRMGSAKYATFNGARIAQRVANGDRKPHLRPAGDRRAA